MNIVFQIMGVMLSLIGSYYVLRVWVDFFRLTGIHHLRARSMCLFSFLGVVMILAGAYLYHW